MANNYIDKDVQFSDISQPTITTGVKIAGGTYVYDDENNIKIPRPVINAIDIDWNNALIEDILNNPIKTTGDLISLIGNIKSNIPNSINDLNGSSNLLTYSDIQALKPQLTGKSAYELAKESYEEANNIAFPYNTIEEWVASLKGDQGDRGPIGFTGRSAYEAAKQYYQSNNIEFPYNSESEWIADIIDGNANKEYIDEKVDNIRDDLQTSITNEINNIIGNASENFDTFKEIEDWINEFNLNPEEIETSINNLNNSINNLKGELTKEEEYEDEQGNIQYREVSKTYDKNGQEYGKSLEEINDTINDLLNTVSVAKDVQDGAEENVIDNIIAEIQNFTINGESQDTTFLNIEKPENSKTITLGVNKELLNNILESNNSTILNQAKQYTNNCLSWNIMNENNDNN